MLNYTKTVIINDASRIVANPTYKNSLGNTQTTSGIFSIKENVTFKDVPHTIKSVTKREYKDAVLAKAVVDLSGLESNNTYRLAIYVRLRNNNLSLYANDWTFKGKPLYVPITVTNAATVAAEAALATAEATAAADPSDTNAADEVVTATAAVTTAKATDAATNAANAVARIKKLSLFEYGTNILKAYPGTGGDANKLVIEATDQWLLFMTLEGHAGVTLERLIPRTSTDGYYEENWESVAGKVNVTNGNEAFGDFAHIIKDLRLPTDANLRFAGIAQGDPFGEPNDDRPNPNGKYNEYVVTYEVDRGIGQQSILGGVGTSRTVHVFYVESNGEDAWGDSTYASTPAGKFEQELMAAFGITNTAKDPTDTTDSGKITVIE